MEQRPLLTQNGGSMLFEELLFSFKILSNEEQNATKHGVY